MDYICSGNVMIDTVQLKDGGTRTSMGGPSLFALTGAAFFSDSVLMVSRVGSDFPQYFNAWFHSNGFSLEGTKIRSDFCNHHLITHHADGTYTEISKYGEKAGNRNFGFLSLEADDISPHTAGAKALYFGRGVENMVVWHDMRELKEKDGFRIMWEIPTLQAVPENLEKIREVLSFVDYFSLNHHEAKALFSTTDGEQCMDLLLETGVPTYYRVGRKGGYILKDGRAVFCPSYFTENEPDPTGCGNCSTAAVMVGLCEGRSAAECGAMGSVAASFNARQFGPYPLIDGTVRAEARRLVEELKGACSE